MRANQALEKLITYYNFDSVLDIGCGEGLHSDIFLDRGKKVTAIDYGKSFYFENNKNKINTIVADFNTHPFTEEFDCIWCSHVLEHQRNPGAFLDKIFSLLKEGGVLAITVPPYKPQIVGGHVSFWNIGLLLYNLILSGFDCREVLASQYKYDLSVIVKKVSIRPPLQPIYDSGDITTIKPYLPPSLEWKNEFNDLSFNGNIQNIGW